MSVIIGSTAIKHWFPDFKREPKDLDIVTVEDKKNETVENVRYEYLINPIIYQEVVDGFASPEVLLTLKMSHVIGWNIFWEKHMSDIIFLQDKGVKYNKELLLELYAYWNTVHDKNKRSDLKMTAEDFFNNAVDTDFDHDIAHELLIKHPFFEGQMEPTYKLILKDGAEVEVDEEKFNLLSEKGKYNLVVEEVMNMAYERWPKEKFWNAYSKMLKKFVISHAPIWEGIWMIENWKWLSRSPFDFKTHLNKELYECRLMPKIHMDVTDL
jgi:hypothetical protein